MTTTMQRVQEALEAIGFTVLSRAYSFTDRITEMRTRQMEFVVSIEKLPTAADVDEILGKIEAMESVGKPICDAVCEHTGVEILPVITDVTPLDHGQTQIEFTCVVSADRGAHRRRRG